MFLKLWISLEYNFDGNCFRWSICVYVSIKNFSKSTVFEIRSPCSWLLLSPILWDGVLYSKCNVSLILLVYLFTKKLSIVVNILNYEIESLKLSGFLWNTWLISFFRIFQEVIGSTINSEKVKACLMKNSSNLFLANV